MRDDGDFTAGGTEVADEQLGLHQCAGQFGRRRRAFFHWIAGATFGQVGFASDMHLLVRRHVGLLGGTAECDKEKGVRETENEAGR